MPRFQKILRCNRFPQFPARLLANVEKSGRLVKQVLSKAPPGALDAAKVLHPGTDDFNTVEKNGCAPECLPGSPKRLSLASWNLRLRNHYLSETRPNGLFTGFREPIPGERGKTRPVGVPILDFPFPSTTLYTVDAFVYAKKMVGQCRSWMTGYFDPAYLNDPSLPNGFLAKKAGIAGSSGRKHTYRSVVFSKFFKCEAGYLAQTFSLTFDAESGNLASMLIEFSDFYWLCFTTGFVGCVEELKSRLT